MGDHDKAELMFYLARQVKAECPLCLYNIANSLYEPAGAVRPGPSRAGNGR